MGERTTISGHIQEAWYVGKTGAAGEEHRWRLLEKANNRTIASLPKIDAWPFLTREMFQFSAPSGRLGPSNTHRGRVIFFGGSFSYLWEDWPHWLEKFEALLRRLYWEHATVIMVTEWLGTYTYQWNVRADAMAGYRLPKPQPPRTWEFTGGPRRF